jgi:uncharacterized membrane protein YgcG
VTAAFAALIGAAIVCGSPAAADPNQDDQFLAALDKQGIPALANVPSLVATAHKVCRKLDGGTPVGQVVEEMTDNAYRNGPDVSQYPRDRLTRTFTRFVVAAVDVYCPYDHGTRGLSLADPMTAFRTQAEQRGWTGISATWLPRRNGRTVPASCDLGDSTGWTADEKGFATQMGLAPAGATVEPTPPQLPAPSVPPAHILKPPQAAPTPARLRPPPTQLPPPPTQLPPPPTQLPPPPPQQSDPPLVAPQPGSGGGGGMGGGGIGGGGMGGGGTGGSGGGGTGGGSGGPAEPSPTPAAPPGLIRVAP